MGTAGTGAHKISAVVLAWNRKPYVETVLDRLSDLPVDEVVVVDHGNDGTTEMVRARSDNAKVIGVGRNLGIAGRNLGAQAAEGDLILMLDDDSYPLPGALEAMVRVLDENPHVAIVGGLVRELDGDGNVFRLDELGTFDWFLRAGATGLVPPEGLPAFFFPEGACLARRDAFLEVGGFLEPFFSDTVELELTTRLLAAGWDVRYQPEAAFDHMWSESGLSLPKELEMRFRNQLWYFWMYFPPALAARRMILYSFFEFFDCAARGAIGAWFRAIVDAYRNRDSVREYRNVLSRDVLRRAEMNRSRMQWRLLFGRIKKVLSRRG